MKEKEEILTPAIWQCIDENKWHEAINQILKLEFDAQDERRRQIAIRLAVEWYQVFTDGLDGRDVPVNIDKTIRQFAEDDNEYETEEDYVEFIWANMCTHAAGYAFAKLQPDDLFTRALVSAYMAHLPEGYGINSIQTHIQRAMRKELTKAGLGHLNNYGVQLNGLQSCIIFPTSASLIPAEADIWLEF